MNQAPEIRRRDRFRIGDWLVEPALNQLSRGSKVERVEPKSVEVLLALAHHSAQVMSRDQLIAEVWNGIAVSDDALTQSIIKLRKALGDTSKEPAYIQTIPKRGYRLIADVSWLDVDGPAAVAALPQSSAGARKLAKGPGRYEAIADPIAKANPGDAELQQLSPLLLPLARFSRPLPEIWQPRAVRARAPW
jgi:DNA-binding winged helix-turn-helix (wHTH) protein